MSSLIFFIQSKGIKVISPIHQCSASVFPKVRSGQARTLERIGEKREKEEREREKIHSISMAVRVLN